MKTTRIRLRTAAATLAALAAGLAPALPGTASVPVCDQTPPSFRPAVRLGTGYGYEPGIEIDSAGTIFVTAHKLSLVREERDRLSSFLWRSTDDGVTWEDVRDVDALTRHTYALEGDLAVDANDKLYYVDTWGADNHFYRYGDNGGTLELYRPAVPSGEADDRPWLAAHGDGVVYYMSNSVWGPQGRLVVHRSLDGGLTFDAGYALPESGWGFLDADPSSSYVYAFVNDLFYGTGLLGDATGVFAYVSPDRGETWERVKVDDYEFGYNETADGHDDAYPVVAVSPVDGSVYALWTDDGRKLKLARSTDRGQTWDVHDVSPFPAGTKYSYPWVTVGPTGDVGIVFQGKVDLTQHVYGMVWRPETECLPDANDPSTVCRGPASAVARLTPSVVGSQADFFQVEMSSDNALNVAWTGRRNTIDYTRQVGGPSVTGGTWCGVIAVP